jgi:ParB family transcriptional regulator, chromosome partitioning protein
MAFWRISGLRWHRTTAFVEVALAITARLSKLLGIAGVRFGLREGNGMDLKHIPIDQIIPNTENPRGIDIPTKDSKLGVLKDSISNFGVLVPIVVTPKGNSFLLIDGERRYHAARAAGEKKLPAYVIAAPNGNTLSDSDVLFRMFQIHHLREQWGPVQQCKALEKLYRDITRDPQIRSIHDPRAASKAVAIRLADETGIDERTALDRVKFLRWPSSIKQRLYADPREEGYWYICEIEEKIILPSLVNYPEYFERVPVNQVRQFLFSKLDNSLTRSTDVRKVAPYFRAELKKAQDKKKVKAVLNALVTQSEMTYDDAQHELQKQFPDMMQRDPPSPRKLVSLLVNLAAELERFDLDSLLKATKRAKAKPSELLEAAQSLREGISDFVNRIREAN